jgi:hypothetical protein
VAAYKVGGYGVSGSEAEIIAPAFDKGPTPIKLIALT